MAHRPSPSSVTRKVAVLGSRGVGKSAIVTTFVSGDFPETYVPTIESTYRKSIRVGRVQFYTEVVDTAGMDEYSRLSRNATIGCHGYVLVFSLSNRLSFSQVQHINEVLTEMLGYAPNIPRVLVGSMADLEDQRQVEQTEAVALADGWGVPYVECSALDDFNVGYVCLCPTLEEKIRGDSEVVLCREIFRRLIVEMERDNGLLEPEAAAPCVLL